MEGIQETQDPPSVVDFDSLVLEPTPINASGKLCDVYRARHPQAGILAVKSPRGMGKPGSWNYRYLLQQAALWKTARHRNVLRFLGTWEANDTVYLVSPFLDNGTVMQYLVHHPDADRTKFILDIARGLTYLHGIGVVHGDIKGTNVLISHTVDALVADFGLANIADSSAITSSGGPGSLPWQSPELLRGATHRTFSSDVYSFGMTIYEILSGTSPFDGVNPFGVINLVAIQKKRPDPQPKLSPSGLSYAMQWKAATRSWNDEPQLRPNMHAILNWLESEGVVRGRIRVVCEGEYQLDGYLADLGQRWGDPKDVIVTGNIAKASIYQRSLKGTFPKRVCEMDNPTVSVADAIYVPSPRTKFIGVHNPVSVFKPEPGEVPLGNPPPWWQAVINGSSVWDQKTPHSPLTVDIWIMSDDGELYPRDGGDRVPIFERGLPVQSISATTRGRLRPFVLSVFSPPKLIFCSDSIDMSHLAIAHLTFEEIDGDVLF